MNKHEMKRGKDGLKLMRDGSRRCCVVCELWLLKNNLITFHSCNFLRNSRDDRTST